MDSNDVLRSISTVEIDYNYLLSKLKDHRFPRNAIGYLLKTGRLLRVKKGIYVKSEGGYCPMVLANMIYGPSYVSQDYALSLHGLIPERVQTITSMTLGKLKTFETPVGVFHYEHLSPDLYHLGIRREEISLSQAYLVATPEKALVDCIWRRPELGTEQSLEEFLIHDRRIDFEAGPRLSISRLRELARAYDKPVVSALLNVAIASIPRSVVLRGTN